MLKPQQRFKREKHNVFTEELNTIVLSANDDNRIQSIDSKETYAYGTNKDLVSKKENIKYNNIIKQYKKQLTEVSAFRKTDSLFNLISHQPDKI